MGGEVRCVERFERAPLQGASKTAGVRDLPM